MTVNEVTPTTEEVRRQWERLLADIERNVAAVAWDEGWDACVEYMNGPDWGQTLPNPYLEGSNND